MEDMARLALVEQHVRDGEKFSKVLFELLGHINHILENPHDYEVRTIRSDLLKTVLKYEPFVDYLKSIGFQPVGNNYTYPKEHTLSQLRMAQAAIERKIYFCCGSLSQGKAQLKTSRSLPQAQKVLYSPVNVLTTSNPFLLKLQGMFNDVLKYEDQELQELAREHIPVVTLQLMALDRCREHQRKLKAGEIKGHDIPFDIALLMELLGWFKHKFFSWVDQPPCDRCSGPTTHFRNSTITTESETCRVEYYKCTRCANGGAEFVRHNDVRALLRTRRGRCGEWANCFAALCRALGYDTRYVFDTTDHVWCEVFDFDSNAWLHVDPCECTLDAPLLYSHGWGKRLAYVIAFSRDDLQDVTWRYTTEHKEVLKRRSLCTEQELISSIMTLREARQLQVSEPRRRCLTKRCLQELVQMMVERQVEQELISSIMTLREARQLQVSEPRRRCLTKRCLQELVQMMVERKPGDSESHGRISGSITWRRERGEIGTLNHVFRFVRPGECSIRYSCAKDAYVVDGAGEGPAVKGWGAGVYAAREVFRKVEDDWRMAYLAREEGSLAGSVSWRVAACPGGVLRSLRVRVLSAIYEDAVITFEVALDDAPPQNVKLNDSWTTLAPKCHSATLTVSLHGGRGSLAWQHAQLFRQPLDDSQYAFELCATLEMVD